MDDFRKKLNERWHQKKSKAMNWTSLLVKTLILVAIIFVINHLSKNKNIDWSSIRTKPDAVQADSVR